MANTGIDQACGGYREFVINGKSLHVYPLRLYEWGLVEGWIRQELITAASKSIDESQLTGTSAELIVREAYHSATRISIMDPDLRAGIMSSIGCMLNMIKLSLDRDQYNRHVLDKKHITSAVISDLMGENLNIIADIAGIIIDLSFPDREGNEKENPTKAEIKTP